MPETVIYLLDSCVTSIHSVSLLGLLSSNSLLMTSAGVMGSSDHFLTISMLYCWAWTTEPLGSSLICCDNWPCSIFCEKADPGYYCIHCSQMWSEVIIKDEKLSLRLHHLHKEVVSPVNALVELFKGLVGLLSEGVSQTTACM